MLIGGVEPPPDVLWRKNIALLTYLALSPAQTRSRDHLLGLLWPEKEQARARHSLNEAMRRLRAALGADRIISRGDSVTLSDHELKVDALEVLGGGGATPEGQFLEGLYLEDAPEFGDWVDRMRERFAGRALDALLARAEEMLDTDPAAAQEAAREALALEPASEPATGLLMRALALSGDTAGALAEYRAHEQRLASSIGEQPGRELRALAERIRGESWKRTAPRSSEPMPDLVGRAEEYVAAFQALRQGLETGPAAIVVTADPGMGRTRLVSELAERAALAGAWTVTPRLLPSDVDVPWNAVRALVRGGLGEAPALAATDPLSLGIMAGIAPSLAERFSPVEARDSAQVASALARLISTVAEETSLMLALDDAHLADGSSLNALQSAMHQLTRVPVVLVLTALESSQDIPRELLRFQSEIGRGIKGAVVQLDPLSEGEIHELVTGWSSPRLGADRERLARRIYYEAGGSPFLAVELLRGLEKAKSLQTDALAWPQPNATLESPLPFSIPLLVRRAITARVVDLDPEAQQVLAAASIGGTALDLDLICSLTDLERARVEDLVEELERHHFVEFYGDRYAFAAPVISEVVRQECLTRGEKQRLRRGAITVLEDRDDLESRVLRTELLNSVDPGPESVRDALSVARDALEAESKRTVKRALAAAEKVATDEMRTELEGMRARIS